MSLLTALLVAAAAAGPGAGQPPASRPAALPEGTARYRMVLGGVAVGLVELSLHCQGPACSAAWDSRQRLPAEAGGGIRARRIEVPVDRAGRAQGAARLVEGGVVREVALPPGAVPAMLAEVALAAATPGDAETCFSAVDERSGAPVAACGRRRGAWLEATVGRERERFRPAPGGFPAEIQLPAQRVSFHLDAEATLPAEPPRLFGTAVPGPDDTRDATAFCGVARDREPAPGSAAGLPPASAQGPTCREQAASWLERARAAGLRGRTAVGVAWDGGGFVWHAWAEVQAGGRWVPIDPAFRQAPARGPRFTLATWAPGDEAGRAEAGRRILGCWGRAAVTGAP